MTKNMKVPFTFTFYGVIGKHDEREPFEFDVIFDKREVMDSTLGGRIADLYDKVSSGQVPKTVLRGVVGVFSSRDLRNPEVWTKHKGIKVEVKHDPTPDPS